MFDVRSLKKKVTERRDERDEIADGPGLWD
jgi:hypothetical protein